MHSTLTGTGVRLLVGASIAAALLVAGAPSALPANAAPDGPGALSHFDLARKDCLGTARNTTSKVWYTVADGVLSDVYYPTADTTNVETLQFVVTDGSTFSDLQTRDTTSTAEALDRGGMECRVTSTAKSGRYRIVTDYLTDPARNTVLLRVRFEPLTAAARNDRVYVRFDPTVNGNGGGGPGNGGADSGTVDTSTGQPVLVASDPVTQTNAVNRDYAQPVFVALDSSTGLSEPTNGFAGVASDPLTQLDASHALTTTYTDAAQGNLVQAARLRLDGGGGVTLALGFGSTQGDAVHAADGSLGSNLTAIRARYRIGWTVYDALLRQPAATLPGIAPARAQELRDAYYVSANVVKASEDKTFPGAIVASLASPWGQAVSAGDPANTYFGSYREIFARDLYEAWTALFAAGDLRTARDAVEFLFERQQLPNGSFPRNSLLNGKVAPDSFGTQLDETAYPILMADQLGMTDATLYRDHVKPAAYYLAAHGPSFGVERWEEQSGFSPSTIAAEIAGLVAAAHIADVNGDAASAAVFRAVADDFQRSIKGWTVTTSGPLAARYFIRLSKTGDPNAAISYNVGNGGPTLDQRSVIDSGFLELSRLGVLAASDADILRSLPVVDATIRTDTASGPGWHRYNGDGYGDGATDPPGHPWAPTGRGTGHLWPALSAERGAHELQTGDPAGAATLLDGMERFAGGVGLIPEQDWELPPLARSPFGTDPTIASIGFVNGEPAGSANPLTWSAGSYVRLMRNLAAGRVVEQPAATFDRYVAHTQGQTSLTVTSPADLSAVTSPVDVTGTSVPGNTIVVAATNTDTASPTATVSTTAAADGSFHVSLPVTGGTTVITVAALSPTGATAHVKRTVVFDFTPGTLLLDVSDPDSDDNGPGNYAYPTSSNFHAGAFDIQRFQIFQDGATTIFKLQTRDLSETFGSPLGAQLVDVYVRNPAAPPADTSTAASFPQRNYAIAVGSAWSRLLEVQGFGQRYVDAHGATLGTIAISANAVSRFITFSVPTASLGGTPGAGWEFTVVLTGQDGFSPDQARNFASTPQDFLFGVCVPGNADAHCAVNPGTVPKAMDVITPTGVSQSDELDYLAHSPVTLQGVVMP